MATQPRHSNEQLRLAMEEAGCSHSRLASSVVGLAAQAHGIRGLKYDHSSVIRWLDGQHPRDPAPELIAQVISERLGRAVTPADLGMRSGSTGIDLGLDLPLGWPDGVAAITALWKAEMDRRKFLAGTGFAISAYASAEARLLTLPTVSNPVTGLGTCRIGASDIAALQEINKTYRQLDNRLGGGYLRSTVVQLLDKQVTPLLRSATFSEAIGRQLASAAAELAQMVGWMAFDTESWPGAAILDPGSGPCPAGGEQRTHSGNPGSDEPASCVRSTSEPGHRSGPRGRRHGPARWLADPRDRVPCG